MSADIILFPLQGRAPSADTFRKALMALAVLVDFDASEAVEIIAAWLTQELISRDEADALYEFYGWKRPDIRCQ